MRPQPARVLAVLLRQAGRLVAMRQVRDALGEHASTPVFVETLPRRGYRFIGDVTVFDTLPPPVLTMAVPESGALRPLAAGRSSLACATPCI